MKNTNIGTEDIVSALTVGVFWPAWVIPLWCWWAACWVWQKTARYHDTNYKDLATKRPRLNWRTFEDGDRPGDGSYVYLWGEIDSPCMAWWKSGQFVDGNGYLYNYWTHWIPAEEFEAFVAPRKKL